MSPRIRFDSGSIKPPSALSIGAPVLLVFLRCVASVGQPQHRMVRFSPDIRTRDHTDPSYHLPAFYELWARWGPVAGRRFWAEAAQASREFFQRTTHPVTALAPDYANFDGTPWASARNPQSADFRFDAWRTAMNWSVDWAWWAQDVRERQWSDRIQAFFESQGLSAYGNQFTLEAASSAVSTLPAWWL